MFKFSQRTFTPLLGATTALALAATVCSFGSASAFATEFTSSDDACVTTGTSVTCTYKAGTIGATWNVPAGVHSASFTLYGAKGGESEYGTKGGLGGLTKATLIVTPQETYQINVGTGGTKPLTDSTRGLGGSNGGGNGALRNGGGGGASDVRRDSDGNYGPDSRMLVAGGGGGGGGCGLQYGAYLGGDGGGLQGNDGGPKNYESNVGKGGTQTTGGQHGGGDGIAGGWDGTFGVGGAGGALTSNWCGGGGGGGGWYGGGGGGRDLMNRDGGGGGGGSAHAASWAQNPTFTPGVNPDGGLVVLNYSLPN